ncbi:hypothetical protein H0H93_011637 [Arthromyces matolae]|nr:hypothetical protein H0H93_011637 [Arthromyces matolae]
MEGKVRRLENEGSIARALVQKVYWENKRLVGVLKGLIDMKKQQQQQEDTDSPFESTPPTKQGEEGEGELAMIIDPKSIPTPTPTPTPSLLPNDKHPPQAKGYDIDNHYPTPNIKKEDPSSSSSSSFPFATTTTTTSFSSTFSSINTNTYQTKPHPTEIDHGLAFDPLVPLLPPSSIKKDELDPDDLDLLWPEY